MHRGSRAGPGWESAGGGSLGGPGQFGRAGSLAVQPPGPHVGFHKNAQGQEREQRWECSSPVCELSLAKASRVAKPRFGGVGGAGTHVTHGTVKDGAICHFATRGTIGKRAWHKIRVSTNLTNRAHPSGQGR